MFPDAADRLIAVVDQLVPAVLKYCEESSVKYLHDFGLTAKAEGSSKFTAIPG
jgi:hypothetical protein